MFSYSIQSTGIDTIQKRLDQVSNVDSIVFRWMQSGIPNEITQESIGKNFESQGRPKWVKLAEETIKARKRLGFGSGPILQRTGNLKEAVTSIKGVSKNGKDRIWISFGRNEIKDPKERMKFAVHQQGYKYIPSRMMLMFQDEDVVKMTSNLSEWIFMQLKI